MRSARFWRGPAVPAILAVLFLLAPAAASQERAASPELAALVPKLADWSLSEGLRSYFPESLFEYIDGAAESYLSYDFRELLVVDLEKKGTGATVTLEIYDMGLPLNAFGIFGAERYPENKAVALGELGYVEGEALNFLAGRFYVKLLAFGLGDATEAGPRRDRLQGGRRGQGPEAGFRRSCWPSPRTASSPGARSTSRGTSWATSSSTTAMSRPIASGGRELEGFFIDGGSDKDAEGMLDPAPRGPDRGQAGRREERGRRPCPEPLRPASLHRPGRRRPLRRDARPRRARGGGGGAPPGRGGRPGRKAGREVRADQDAGEEAGVNDDRFFKGALAIVLLFVAGVVLKLARPVLLPFILAVFLSYIIDPALTFSDPAAAAPGRGP